MVLLSVVMLLAVCAGQPAEAESLPTVTLADALAQALEHNPLVLQAGHQAQQAACEQAAARADLLPKVRAGYSFTWLEDVRSTNIGGVAVPLNRKDNYAFDVTLSQPLFTGFSLISAYKLATIGLQEAQTREQLARIELVYQVKSAYFSLLLARKMVGVAAEVVTGLASHLRDARHFYEQGLIPRNDLLQSEVELANGEQGYRLAVKEEALIMARLAVLMQRPRDWRYDVEDVVDVSPVTLDLAAVTEAAFAERPELRVANYQLNMAAQQIVAARSAYFPQLTFTAQHERIGDSPDVSGNGIQNPYETSLMVAATWDVWDWQKRHSQVKQAQTYQEETRLAFTQVMDDIGLEVKENFLQVNFSFSNIETTRVRLAQGQENYRITDLRYKNQLSTSTEVLDALTLLARVQFDYYKSRYEYHSALAGLARAIGRDELFPEGQ